MEGQSESYEALLERIGKGLDTHAVFGEAQTLDGTAVIPVARISYGGGGGFGGGTGAPGEAQTGEIAEGVTGSGEGMGGGFGAAAQPLGVIQVKEGSVRWVPIVDVTKLASIWAVVSGLLLIMAVGRMFRRH